MSSRDEQLDEWIVRDGLKKERRQRIVPASTDRLSAEDPGDGEAALETVAAWLGTDKELPLVELATLSRRVIALTFAEPTILPEPWVSEAGDPYEPHDQWGITLQHALGLPRGSGYGWQVAGLTGLGTLADGSRGLLNTSRWEILGIAGTPEWTRNLMITQAMNQAAEPWSAEHDIWLIGYGDTAEKLVSFLAPYHPVHRFHIAESLDVVSADDLDGSTSTLYVMGAGSDTEVRFKALQASGIGMVTDEVISDQAMFLSEREGGVAVLGPFQTNLEIYPNSSPELITKMELAWEANQEAAAQKFTGADFTELLDTSASEKSAEEVEADFKALVAQVEDDGDRDEGQDAGSSEEAVAPEEFMGHEEDVVREPTATSTAVSKDGELDSGAEEEDAATSEPDKQEGTGDKAASVAADTSNDVNRGKGAVTSDAPEVHVTLLGKVRTQTAAGELVGRNAEALAMLALAVAPLNPRQISESLWPGDEPEGHTARTRRSRMLSKLREHAGTSIAIADDGWSIVRENVQIDHEQVIDSLTNASLDQEETITEACSQVLPPLVGVGQWADEYRDKMTESLQGALAELKDRAIEAEAFDVAKAAKTAQTKLGEA